MKYSLDVALRSRSIMDAKDDVMTTRLMQGFLLAALRMALTPAIAGRISSLRLSVVA